MDLFDETLNELIGEKRRFCDIAPRLLIQLVQLGHLNTNWISNAKRDICAKFLSKAVILKHSKVL